MAEKKNFKHLYLLFLFGLFCFADLEPKLLQTRIKNCLFILWLFLKVLLDCQELRPLSFWQQEQQRKKPSTAATLQCAQL